MRDTLPAPARAGFLPCLALVIGVALPTDAIGAGRVTLLHVPDGSIQPQAVADASGAVHVVSYRGEARGGDVDYRRLDPGAAEFTAPIRVNSQPRSAVAAGTIRGAQIALGRGGRVHVAWNGTMGARPANPLGGAPMLYSRSDPGRTAFEPERNLMTRSTALDGGGTVAADGSGRVLVAWHARPAGAPEGEIHRRMFVARSDNDGATFAPEASAIEADTGACPCCGTRALMTRGGSVFALYRSATKGIQRDITLLSSADRGDHFQLRRVDPWSLNMCPMSSMSLAEGPTGVLAAWETQGQVYVASIDAKSGTVAAPVHPRGAGGNRKHPAVAVNSRGEWVVAWAEGTSFQRGGALAWRVFNADGKPTDEGGRLEDAIPTHSLPTAVARPDGFFLVIH